MAHYKKIKLITSDDDFEIEDRDILLKSKFLEEILDNGDETEDETEIYIQEINGKTFKKVLDFLKHHQNNPMVEIKKPIENNDMNKIVGEWDANFIDVDLNTLYCIINAANYLNIPSLLDLGLAKIASLMYNKDEEENMKIFGVNEKITEEEKITIAKNNPWLFEVDQEITNSSL